jgi:hypothetical protein
MLTAALLVLLVNEAAAQGFGPVTASRQGLWLGGGIGHGWTRLSCGICGGERETGGYSGYLRAGGTVTPRFLLGGELDAWYRNGEELTEHLEALSVTGYFYPSERHGWFVKLGAGVTQYRATEGDDALASRSFSLQAGGGYEMRVSPRLSVVPSVTLLATPNGNLNRESTEGGGFHADRVATDLKLFVIQFGVGITRH